jgi:hypothetical protein
MSGSERTASRSIGTAGFFGGTTPKLEVVTGSGAGTYEEAVVIRHDNKDATAVLRRLGLLLKLNTEVNDGESDKYGGIVVESSETHANNPDLRLVLVDTTWLSFDNVSTAANRLVNISPSGQNALRVWQDRGVGIVDGVSTPATRSGWGIFYIDSADGDLKFKFGDGTIKTLATDT